MSDVKIFWDPLGLELDTLSKRKFQRVSDGDTPYVEMSIRMLSIDTPEKFFSEEKWDENLTQLAEWIQTGKAKEKAELTSDLGEYLYPKLATGNAATLQKEQGKRATETFEKLLNEKLTKPNGKKRGLYLRVADQPFDQYGRLPQRTGNLQLVDGGVWVGCSISHLSEPSPV
ncbi:MAG: hypothetical protein HXS46_07850 [Theionarchaea archaeon]|nr:MAG: hypothetical protein AYK18_07395 [Theionarchaea archaeon DG-70]MBU7010590.1 hypothetical protein [Theionarchaea archaeon]